MRKFLLALALVAALLPLSAQAHTADIEALYGSGRVPYHISMTLRCTVAGAGGIAVYIAHWNAYGGISRIWREYVTAGFASSAREHWAGFYRWYELALIKHGIGVVATANCSGR